MNVNINSERFSNPREYSSIVDSTYVTFWKALQHNQPNMPMSVMAQGIGSGWGNWGMHEMGYNPKRALNNSPNYIYSETITTAWNGLYEVLGTMNDFLSVMQTNQAQIIDELGAEAKDELIANAKGLQGLSLGYLSLLYDQAYIVDENSDPSSSNFSTYEEVNDAAGLKLAEAIGLFQGSDVEITGWNGLVYVGDNAADLLKAFMAKFEVLQARNLDELQNIDWSSVLANTTNDILDLAPIGNDKEEWWHRMLIQGQDPNWVRMHQKIIKMMNPNKPDSEVPYPYPGGIFNMPEINDPEDIRVNTDFTYKFLLNPGRLAYLLSSNYIYNRYSDYRTTLTGPMNFFTASEVSLLRAEAILKTGGDRSVAASIINNTRVLRGGLQPLTGAENLEVLLQAISYERFVEFTFHAACNVWFYRRIITPPGNQDSLNVYYLEPNSARHFPVPGFELNFNNLPIYTFGGAEPEQ
ncbi:RagB/SusD family nutrient uptake outer membrane protein [Roseivirga sp. E12]|uniref:RagB/SusD family nutrient uptake outer membrane protein n=1 Tax=Roseivirga sp. E12 TaxID=2819237 RepID=UPI001ABC36BD|nr:RagB/SusD family nutrient uptake outer membrane protein [Roseivirga sp. E12]MBO3700686.1 hypothetical protein [Roseivirga sp. E12]